MSPLNYWSHFYPTNISKQATWVTWIYGQILPSQRSCRNSRTGSTSIPFILRLYLSNDTMQRRASGKSSPNAFSPRGSICGYNYSLMSLFLAIITITCHKSTSLSAHIQTFKRFFNKSPIFTTKHRHFRWKFPNFPILRWKFQSERKRGRHQPDAYGRGSIGSCHLGLHLVAVTLRDDVLGGNTHRHKCGKGKAKSSHSIMISDLIAKMMIHSWFESLRMAETYFWFGLLAFPTTTGRSMPATIRSVIYLFTARA